MKDIDSRTISPRLMSNEVLGFDIFGFAIFKADQIVDSERHHEYKKRTFPKAEIAAWEKLFEEWESKKTTLNGKIHTYLRRGVPPHLRPTLWKKLLDIQAWQSSVSFNYQSELSKVRAQLVDLGISEYGGQAACTYLSELELDSYRVKYGDVSMDALRHIFLDLERSYPTHRMFMGDSPEAKEGRASMFRVLATYARFNTEVEYCQGMASIAGMFLMQMGDEEDAFWCLLSLLERQKYLLGYFDNSMERVKKHAAVYDKLLAQRFPKLQSHVERLEINPLMYITPWFMVLFTSLPCWDSVLAIWDLLLMEGNKTLFQVALSILEALDEDIRSQSDLCYVLPDLLHPPVKVVEYDTLMPLVWTTHIEDWEISSLLSVISEEKNHLVVPPIGQKRKHSAQDLDKTVTFTGVPDKRKRQKILTKNGTGSPSDTPRETSDPSNTPSGTSLPAERPVKPANQEVSVFKRFVNMFTPKPDPIGQSSPRPRHLRSRSAKKGRHSIGAERRKGLRLTQHSRQQLHIPSSDAKTKTLNIDKGYPLRLSPTTTATTTVTNKENSIVKPAENKLDVTELGEDLLKIPNIESRERLKPDLLQHVKTGGKVSPCLEASENNFLECDRLAALKISTPTRRSPRLLQKRALRDVNSSLVLSNSLTRAQAKHSFKVFKSAAPLRRSQRGHQVLTPPFMASPVMEMKPLRKKIPQCNSTWSPH